MVDMLIGVLAGFIKDGIALSQMSRYQGKIPVGVTCEMDQRSVVLN